MDTLASVLGLHLLVFLHQLGSGSGRLPIAQSSAVAVARLCGNKQSRFIRFSNGEDYCVLYRQNIEQVASEALAFRLSRLVDVGEVPPAQLGVFNASNAVWRAVAPQLLEAGWKNGHPLVYVPFVRDLRPVYFPVQLIEVLGKKLADARTRGHVDRPPINSSEEEVRRLEQFTDLIVFDYVTCNTDRTVSNLHSYQWNDETLSFPIRNVYQTAHGLTFLDNELGILHGYRTLGKYGHYLELLLSSTCVFRRSLIASLEQALRYVQHQLDHRYQSSPSPEPIPVSQSDSSAYLTFPSKSALLNEQEKLSISSQTVPDFAKQWLPDDSILWPVSVTKAVRDSLPIIRSRLSAVIEHFKFCQSVASS